MVQGQLVQQRGLPTANGRLATLAQCVFVVPWSTESDLLALDEVRPPLGGFPTPGAGQISSMVAAAAAKHAAGDYKMNAEDEFKVSESSYFTMEGLLIVYFSG